MSENGTETVKDQKPNFGKKKNMQLELGGVRKKKSFKDTQSSVWRGRTGEERARAGQQSWGGRLDQLHKVSHFQHQKGNARKQREIGKKLTISQLITLARKKPNKIRSGGKGQTITAQGHSGEKLAGSRIEARQPLVKESSHENTAEQRTAPQRSPRQKTRYGKFFQTDVEYNLWGTEPLDRSRRAE